MNNFNFTGIVKNFGTKGGQFKKLWIAAEIPNKLNAVSTVFLNFDLDANSGSKKYKLGEFIQSRLAKDKAIFLSGALMCLIKFSKPDGSGGWETEERVGVRGNLSNLVIFDTQQQNINIGFLEGKIVKHNGKKMVIEESYRVPTTNEWKTRPVPILIEESISYLYSDKNLIGSSAFICGEVMGADNTVYIHARQLVVK